MIVLIVRENIMVNNYFSMVHSFTKKMLLNSQGRSVAQWQLKSSNAHVCPDQFGDAVWGDRWRVLLLGSRGWHAMIDYRMEGWLTQAQLPLSTMLSSFQRRSKLNISTVISVENAFFENQIWCVTSTYTHTIWYIFL